MESTGCYHINLFSFLTSEGIRTVVVNPLLISNFAKLSLRKTKTDKKDARTIARFLMEHHEEISQLSLSQDVQDHRDLSRERVPLSSDRSHQGGNQEGVEGHLSGARIDWESLQPRDASFPSAVSFGSFGEGGETEGHRKGFEGALCGE